MSEDRIKEKKIIEIIMNKKKQPRLINEGITRIINVIRINKEEKGGTKNTR